MMENKLIALRIIDRLLQAGIENSRLTSAEPTGRANCSGYSQLMSQTALICDW